MGRNKRPKRPTSKSAKRGKKVGKHTGKLTEHVFWDEPVEGHKTINISTAKLRREYKRSRAKQELPKLPTIKRRRPQVMAQPLSHRGAFAEGTEISVPSTAIFWVEYYPSVQFMIVAFRVSGEYYTYFKVPESRFQAFKLAPSKGRYFNKYIKGHYNFARGAIRP